MAAQKLAIQIEAASACQAPGVSRATFYRRRRPVAEHQQPRVKPVRALDEAERETALDELSSPRFVDRSPADVVATLLDEDRYANASQPAATPPSKQPMSAGRIL